MICSYRLYDFCCRIIVPSLVYLLWGQLQSLVLFFQSVESACHVQKEVCRLASLLVCILELGSSMCEAAQVLYAYQIIVKISTALLQCGYQLVELYRPLFAQFRRFCGRSDSPYGPTGS